MKKLFGFILLFGSMAVLLTQAGFSTAGILTALYGPEILSSTAGGGSAKAVFMVVIGINILLALIIWGLLFAPPIVYRYELWMYLRLDGADFKIIGWHVRNLLGFLECIRKKEGLKTSRYGSG